MSKSKGKRAKENFSMNVKLEIRLQRELCSGGLTANNTKYILLFIYTIFLQAPCVA